MSKPSKPSPAPAVREVPHRAVRLLLCIICFVAGAAMMIVEISANRLLAPNFGNSLHTWTALIGVILIAFSAGGFLGGYWVEKLPRLALLGRLLAASAVLTMLIPALNTLCAESFASGGVIAGPVMISLLLFAIPGVLLGAVSPAAVRLISLEGHDTHVGIAAGTVSMLGSLGSFVGTFLAGFVLLSSFGVKAIFLGTGIVLLLLAALAFYMGGGKVKPLGTAAAAGIIAFIIGFVAEPKVEAEVKYQANSFYHLIRVKEESPYGPMSRDLYLDNTLEGGQAMKDGALVLGYQRFWQLAELNEELKIKRALFIGAGAFGMPEQVSKANPDAVVDVVEIDPAVIETGRKFFKLDEFPRVHAHASDARRFLKTSQEKYDLILGDAYNGIRHIPAHLVTREFFAEVRERLSDDGVFLMNVICAREGPHSELLRGLLGTLRAVFPNVEAFGVERDPQQVQNVILLGSMKSWKPWIEERFHAEGTWQKHLQNAHVDAKFLPEAGATFTDDWNPVDAIIARQLAQ